MSHKDGHCPSCDNAFQQVPRGKHGYDLTFSHIPKVLEGCLHTICQSCAEEKLQRSGDASSIKCPLCGVTSDNVTTTTDLQDNILALQDLRGKSKDCDYCDETVQAFHFCNECQSLLCTFHANAHAVSRGTKDHKLVALSGEGLEGVMPREIHRVPITCGRHKDVPAKLFCSEPCAITICYDCSVSEHRGHRVFLADSEEAEVKHRSDLTRQGVTMGHRLASLQGALDAIEAVKTGVEQHSRMAEKTVLQFFSDIRAAADSREKAVLKKLRRDRARKTRDLDAQLEKLEQTVNAYTTALEMTDTCVEKLRGNQLLAMLPALRECIEKHDASFPLLELQPCVEDRVEFEHDRRVAGALRLAISQIGYIVESDADFRHVPDRAQKKDKSKAPELSTPNDHNIHFTLAATVGARPRDATAATPMDVVVVEVRKGSEHEFLENGIPGPLIGRVALHTKLEGVKHLAYESEHFFESLTQQAAPEHHQARKQPQRQSQKSSTSYFNDDEVPTVRFTKTLHVLGRSERG